MAGFEVFFPFSVFFEFMTASIALFGIQLTLRGADWATLEFGRKAYFLRLRGHLFLNPTRVLFKNFK